MLLRKRTNNLFDDFFGEMFDDPFFTQSMTPQLMKTDVLEKDGQYLLDIELPGYEKKDVQAELKDGYLTITASTTKNNDEKNKDGKYIRKERFSGTCSRSFYVGDAITQEDVKAKFENGVLTLMVPKKDETPKVENNKYIAIEG